MNPKTVALIAALVACAEPRFALAEAERPTRWGPYSLELVEEGGAALPAFEHRGRSYVLGTLGQRYLIRVRNGSDRRAEVVVSVDGRDVLDGRPAARGKRGYIVEPFGEVTIDGFRLTEAAVAAFRFSSVPRSYAARLGDARDVGVIGLAVFPERAPRWRPPAYERPAEPYGGKPERGAEKKAERGDARQADAAASPTPGAGDAPPSAAPSRSRGLAQSRPGLGTEFGEEHGSWVRQVQFEREGAQPRAVLTLRYDDRPGLLALGIDVDGAGRAADEAWLRDSAEPFRGNAFARPPPGWSSR